MHYQPGYMTRPATSSETGRCLSKPCCTLQHAGSETTPHRQAVPFAHVSKQNDILRSRAASPMRPADAGLHPTSRRASPTGKRPAERDNVPVRYRRPQPVATPGVTGIRILYPDAGFSSRRDNYRHSIAEKFGGLKFIPYICTPEIRKDTENAQVVKLVDTLL